MRPGDAYKTHAQVDEGRMFATGCAGRFVVVFNDGVRPAEAECDGCSARLGIPQRVIVAGWGAPSGPIAPPVVEQRAEPAPDGQQWAEF